MKKYIRSLLMISIFLIAAVCFPKSASAEEHILITDWVVDAFLIENGDLQISEDITFKFNDKFNGVYRDIVTDGKMTIDNIKVVEVLNDNTKDYTLVREAKKGYMDVFTTEINDNKIELKIFSPSKNEKKTFRISYDAKNVAVRYKDTGELYYKFLGDDNKTTIKKFTVNINLPQEDNSGKVKVFAHGPEKGDINKINNSKYELKIKNIPSKTFIEGRVIFPPEFIATSYNYNNIDRYQEIIDEEIAFRENIEHRKQKKEDRRLLLSKITLVFTVISVLVFAFVLYQCKRRINRDFLKTEYRDIPEDCTPAVAAYIIGMYVTTNMIFATILDLFRKKYLRISPDDESVHVSNNKNFLIHKTKEEDMFILGHERYFMHWLFDKLGDGEVVSTNDIAYNNKHNFQEFYNSQNTWKSKIKAEANSRGYLDQGKKLQAVVLILISIIDMVLGFVTAISGGIYALFSLVFGIVLLVYAITLFFRLSDKGYMQYKKWMSFKKYMTKGKQKLSMDDALDSLDPSLIYALSLNVVKNNAAPNDTSDVYSTNSWIFWYLMFSSSSNNAFSSSITKSFVGSGSSSSSSGSFSGGGGGGVGGGGAGGF